jgi:predicted Rossmann fold flavoprotein
LERGLITVLFSGFDLIKAKAGVYHLGVEKYTTVVIGGGAAGICAAISAGRRGEPVIICEKMPQLGKKILATGNGRCNLLNDDLSEFHYNPAARGLVKSIFDRWGKREISGFFQGLGLRVYSQEGRIFPVTNQAASVLKVLEMELKRLSIPVEFNFSCSDISFNGKSFLISSLTGQKVEGRKVILTGGGQTYPALGSDGSLYKIAARLGHTLVEPVPAVVPLVVKDPLCQILQGQRIAAGARSIIRDRRGEESRGELLFTKYGLSGTCILDISEEISLAIHRQHLREVFVGVDMVPFMDREQLKNELETRERHNYADADMLVGILPNKLGGALRDLFTKSQIEAAVNSLKERRFKVAGTRGWNEAEFTSGGVNVAEIQAGTLESRIQKGLYFAGEILDVNGQRGGYNLGWAWASGLTAGHSRSDSNR